MATAPDQAAPLGEGDEAARTASALPADACAVAHCASLVSGKWTLLIIRDLAEGPKYFNQLESSLAGISPRTLCDRLRFLDAHGLALRTRIKGLPPRSMYELTERGHALVPVIEAMRAAGEALVLSTPGLELTAADIAAADTH